MLPLGVDLGSSRVRIALAEAAAQDEVRVRAVAARDIPEGLRADPRLVATLIEEITGELGVKRRACVCSLGGSDASLRVIRFPNMSRQERLRAARFEAQRFASTRFEGAPVVRVHRADRHGNFAVGVTSESAVKARVSLLKHARMRAIAIDHDALALQRAVPGVDAILDIGADRSTLHHYTAASPISHSVAVGGADVTRGIAREFAIDVSTAEKRKRILGSAGAGTVVRSAVVSEFVTLIERARARSPIGRVALVGNGARLPGLVSELQRSCGAEVELMVPPLLQTDAYPEDVLRSAAPDWTLAAALTTWGLAR
jgi:Tfp pilus assembly PilM family ATPase